jgi:sulfur carrier protein ThiS
MRVTIKLVGGLVHTVGFSERVVDLPVGTTVAGLLDTIGIDPARPLIVGRNGWAIETDDKVHDGDRILISPVFSGG